MVVDLLHERARTCLTGRRPTQKLEHGSSLTSKLMLGLGQVLARTHLWPLLPHRQRRHLHDLVALPVRIILWRIALLQLKRTTESHLSCRMRQRRKQPGGIVGKKKTTQTSNGGEEWWCSRRTAGTFMEVMLVGEARRTLSIAALSSTTITRHTLTTGRHTMVDRYKCLNISPSRDTTLIKVAGEDGVTARILDTGTLTMEIIIITTKQITTVRGGAVTLNQPM